MNLETIERLIDKAIEEEDYEKLLKLLNEREKILKNMEVTPQIAEEIMERDKKRLEMMEKKKASLIKTIMSSREYGKSLKSYGKSISEQGKRNWGRG